MKVLFRRAGRQGRPRVYGRSFSAPKDQVGWAAGLFEGEGSLFIKQGRWPMASLASGDHDVLYRFRDVVGVGSVSSHGAKCTNVVMKQWTVQGVEGVQHVIAIFWNYLGERRKAKAIEVARHWGDVS